jgi:LPXTG-motif cell wall-anchored protein
VPDLGTSLSLLGLGVAAAGAYSIYRKRKAK